MKRINPCNYVHVNIFHFNLSLFGFNIFDQDERGFLKSQKPNSVIHIRAIQHRTKLRINDFIDHEIL